MALSERGRHVSPLKLRLVTGDTPNVILSAVDKHTGQPVDLSAAGTLVRLKTRPVGGATTTVTDCTKLSGRELPGGVDYTAPYDQLGKGGRVLAACDATVFPAPGLYEGELEISLAGGQVATPYAMLRIEVRADLD